MSKKNNTPLTCMQLVRRNCMIKCCIFVPFLLLTLPVVIMMLLEMNTIGESVAPFIICLAISAVSIISLFAAIRGQIAPSKSHLGKCVLLHGGGASSIEELFAQVDKDIQESSRIYKNIYR